MGRRKGVSISSLSQASFLWINNDARSPCNAFPFPYIHGQLIVTEWVINIGPQLTLTGMCLKHSTEKRNKIKIIVFV